jgi:hypothetical protein
MSIGSDGINTGPGPTQPPGDMTMPKNELYGYSQRDKFSVRRNADGTYDVTDSSGAHHKATFSEMVFMVQMHSMQQTDTQFEQKLHEVQERNKWVERIESFLKEMQSLADDADSSNKAKKKPDADSSIKVTLPANWATYFDTILNVTKGNVRSITGAKDIKVKDILFEKNDYYDTPLIKNSCGRDDTKISLSDLKTLVNNTQAKYDNLGLDNQTAMTRLNQFNNQISTDVQLCSSMLNTIYQGQMTAVRME